MWGIITGHVKLNLFKLVKNLIKIVILNLSNRINGNRDESKPNLKSSYWILLNM